MRPLARIVTVTTCLAVSALNAATVGSDAVRHAPPNPLPPAAVTSDWPCLLGPTHNEVCVETHLLRKFPANGPRVVWEIAKGEGYACPAIRGDRLVLFHRLGDAEVIDCLDALTGKRFWQYTYPTAYEDDFGYCNGPRGSPVIGQDAVFAVGAEGKLHCLELATGKLRWQHDLAAEFKLKKGFFGVGASPLVEGNLLVVNVGAQGGPCVVAFDVKTGKQAWAAGNQWGASYATPVAATLHGKRRVLVFAGGKSNPPTGGLLCIDPATGKTDFEFPWRGTVRESVNASSPLVVGNRVFVSECYGSGGVLLDIDEHFRPAVVWTNPNFGTHFMTAVAKDGYLYGVDGHGPNDAFLVCVDLNSGKEVWRTQPEWEEIVAGPQGPRTIPTGTYRCWLMPADGHVLCLGEFGHLLRADLDPKGFHVSERAWLFDAEETWTPPALSKGLLYISQNAPDALHHTGRRLICYDLRGD